MPSNTMRTAFGIGATSRLTNRVASSRSAARAGAGAGGVVRPGVSSRKSAVNWSSRNFGENGRRSTRASAPGSIRMPGVEQQEARRRCSTRGSCARVFESQLT